MSEEQQIIPMEEWNRSTLKFFARYDGPYKKKTIALGNHALRKIFEKNFEYMSRNFYFISAFGRFLLGHEREEEVVKAETITENTIKNAIKFISHQISDAQKLMNSNGVDADMCYSKPKVMGVQITSQGISLYNEMMSMADQFYSLNAVLWMDGIITSQQKFEHESAVRREIKNAIKGVASQFIFILKKTRDRDEHEANKAGQHDEIQLVEAAEASVDEESRNGMISNIKTEGPAKEKEETPAPAAAESKSKAKAKAAEPEAKAA